MAGYNTVLTRWNDQYVVPNDIENWKECRFCNHKPRVWEFDNGRIAQCACSKDFSRYAKRSVESESILALVRRTGGDIRTYDRDALRKAWNDYVIESYEWEVTE